MKYKHAKGFGIQARAKQWFPRDLCPSKQAYPSCATPYRGLSPGVARSIIKNLKENGFDVGAVKI